MEFDKKLYNYGLNLTRNKFDAEDLFQDTCFQALKGHYQEEGKVDAWLMTIMKHRFLTFCRNKRIRKEDCIDDIEESGFEYDDRIEDRVIAKQIFGIVLSSISDCYKSVIFMVSYGYTVREISEKLNLPLGTVLSRSKRGKEQIRRIMESL